MRTRFPGLKATLATSLLTLPVLAFAQAPATPANTPPATTLQRTAPAALPAPTTMGSSTALPSSALPQERASKIIGSKVYNERKDSIGEIEDIVIERGTVPVAVIGVGGFLGMGGRLVAVPLSELRYDTTDRRWDLAGATKESLQSRAVFTYDQRKG